MEEYDLHESLVELLDLAYYTRTGEYERGDVIKAEASKIIALVRSPEDVAKGSKVTKSDARNILRNAFLRAGRLSGTSDS